MTCNRNMVLVPAQINLFKHGHPAHLVTLIVQATDLTSHTYIIAQSSDKNACWLIIIRKLCCYVLQYIGTWSAAIIVMGIPLRQPPTNHCSAWNCSAWSGNTLKYLQWIVRNPDRAMKQQQPSSEIHQNPPNISNNQSVISEIPWPPPKNTVFFLSSPGCHILGCNIQLRCFDDARRPRAAVPLERPAGGSTWALDRCETWRDVVRRSEHRMESSGDWNLVSEIWSILVSNG